MSKKKPTDKPIHNGLEELNVRVNEFGEIKCNLTVDKINDFLNKNVEDKKLKERDEKQTASLDTPEITNEEWDNIPPAASE